MNVFVEKLAAVGRLTPEQVKGIEERVAELVKAAEKDPTILVEAQEKLGGIFDSARSAGGNFGRTFTSQVPTATANLVALSLVGGAAGAVAEAYKSVRDSVGKAKAYKDMMDNAGDRISDLPAKQIQQSFNTLYRVNKEYAKDPVIAAEFVRETNRSEAYPFQLLKTMQPAGGRDEGLLGYSKILPNTKANDFQSADEQARGMAEMAEAKKEHKVPSR